MYFNVDPKHCQVQQNKSIEIDDLNADAEAEDIITEPIDQLYIKGKIQIAKSQWSVGII